MPTFFKSKPELPEKNISKREPRATGDKKIGISIIVSINMENLLLFLDRE